MMLLSIQPGFHGEPCRVRVYSCARGSLLRMQMVDVKFDAVPNHQEVIDLQKRPLAFVASASEPEVA